MIPNSGRALALRGSVDNQSPNITANTMPKTLCRCRQPWSFPVPVDMSNKKEAGPTYRSDREPGKRNGERDNMKDVLFSSKTDQWPTPQDFYDELDREFHFTLDPCADAENHKTMLYFTKEQDGLKQDWGGHIVFCNPPYGKDINRWVEKAYMEGHKDGTIVVLLIPARTDTRWFHDYVYHRAEIRHVKGRLKYGGGRYNAPFPSMVVIFRGPKM